MAHLKSSLTEANRQAAKDCAKHEIPIIPVRLVERDGEWQKVPCISNWQNRGTTDPKKIDAWWDKFPDAMPGIPTGPISGFYISDVDRKNGKDGFAALEAEGIDPYAVSPIQVESPGDSLHSYLEAEPGLGCSGPRDAEGKRLSGVDGKGEGGFVMAPGAVTPKGTYRFRKGDLDTLAAMRDARTLPTLPDRLRPRRRPVEPGEGNPTGLANEVILSALEALPNDGDEFADRQDWLDIGMALHCEFGGGEDGRAAFHGWSSQWPGYSAEATDATWDSFKAGGGITGRTIIWEARRRGWTHPAVDGDDFDLEDVQVEAAADPDAEAEDDGPFFLDMADVLAQPAPPREWHVADWIPAKTVHMLGGDGGTGKSLLGIQLAVATGTGCEWLGHEIGKPGPAIYYGAEDDKDELHRRFADVCHGLDVDPAEHRGRVLLRSAVAEDTVFAIVDGKGKVKPTKVLKRIEREIAAFSPSLVVLDTLANLHALDPNSQEHAKAFVGLLIGIAQRHGCTFVLLAHPSRTGMASGDGDGFSVGWNNGVRSRSYLTRDKDNPKILTLALKKVNAGQPGLEMKVEWQDGMFVKVNNEYADASRAKFVFLEILDRLWGQGQFYSNSLSTKYAPNRFAEEPEAEAAGLSKDQLAKAMKAMLKDGVLRIEDYQTADYKDRKRLARGERTLTDHREDFSDDDV